MCTNHLFRENLVVYKLHSSCTDWIPLFVQENQTLFLSLCVSACALVKMVGGFKNKRVEMAKVVRFPFECLGIS